MPEKFPSEEQMTEFLYNYLLELEPKMDDLKLNSKASKLYKVSLKFYITNRK